MKFRKKPVVIDAIQFNSITDLYEMCVCWDRFVEKHSYDGSTLKIHTKEGDMRAKAGDWVIRGIEGEFYPCDPMIFKMTYEPVE